MAAEIYIDRVKKCLAKQMRAEWSTLLNIEYLTKIACWASLGDLQRVIHLHGDKFTQIILNSTAKGAIVPSHDLSFGTLYILAVLFLMVKASTNDL